MINKNDMLYDLCEAITDELADYTQKIRTSGKMSSGDAEAINTLTHSLKSVETVLAMSDYDEGGGSYAGGNRGGGRSREGGMSGARGRSRRTGRYVSREGGMSGRRGYSREGGMSYDGARDELMEHVEELMGMADDEPTKQMIRRFKMELEKS